MTIHTTKNAVAKALRALAPFRGLKAPAPSDGELRSG
jgi:hypothetical protein